VRKEICDYEWKVGDNVEENSYGYYHNFRGCNVGITDQRDL
jgi:hypothetical protein